MRRATIGLLVVLLLAPSTAGAWGFDTHKFIMSRAIDLLPDAIRPFFEANRAVIVERSIDPDLWRNAGFADESPRHYVDMDNYGAYPFTALPRDYDAALKKFGPDQLARNGLLPWRVPEIAGRLIRGFEGLQKGAPYARNDVMYFSSIIGHYVADAHVPLHSVENHNGQFSGQTGIHYRFEEELVQRYQKQLTIAPGPLKHITNERDFIFDALLESTKLVPGVLAADKEAIGNRDLYDDQYFDAFLVKARPILEKRLNDAITGVASVITSAWEQAGKPALPANPPPRAPQRRIISKP